MQFNQYPELLAQASSLVSSRQFHAARLVCLRLIEIAPQRAEGWLLQGKIQQETGAFKDALESVQRVLVIQPKNTEAYLIMGHACLGLRRLADAFDNFKTVTELEPENVNAYIAMGVTYQSDNYFREALSCYCKALEYQPDLLTAHYNCGLIHEILAEYDKALESFRKAHLINPSQPEPVIAEAGVQEKKGEFDAAIELLLPLIDSGIEDVQAAVVYARLCKHVGQCADAIRYLDQLLNTKTLSSKDQFNLHFMLGKLYDSAGDYDPAFKHYQMANSGHGADYDLAADTRIFDTLIETCSRLLLDSAPAPSIHSGQPVFIIGMPRSGTSLVEKILASHPDVVGGGEMPDIINMTDALTETLNVQQPYPGCLDKLTSQTVEKLIQQYVSQLQSVSSIALRVTDKMPHNFLHLLLIRILFPDAPIIHCVRHPLDACLSCYFQCFVGNGLPYSYNLFFVGQHYRNYQRLMKHWKCNVGISMLDVNYEALVNDQEKVSRQLIGYCGLPWNEACLEFHKTAHLTRTASYDQVRRPLYSTSIGRWKHYEKHLLPLKNALGMLN